jgi:hypothetical protein
MNVQIVITGRRIEPFNDPIGDTPVLNRSLRDWQEEAFQAAALVRVEEPRPPYLCVPDTLFATGGALRAFVQGAAGRDAVLVLKRSTFAQTTTPLQPGVTEVEGGWRFDAIRFHSGDGREPVPVVVDPEEKVVEFAVPRQFAGTGKANIAMPKNVVMTLHHWVHLLWANQFASSVQMRNVPRWQVVLALASAILRARSVNKWKVLGKLNRIGAGCDIHPTAIIEGSTLGRGVKVGPFSRVLFSTLGDGVEVMSGGHVEASAMGAGSVLCQQCMIRFCVLYPQAVAAQALMQQCVLGRETLTCSGSWSIDINFERDIHVELDGALQSTGLRCLGSAFGHRSRIGTGFWLASGRMVPNDYFLIRDPQKILAKLPKDLGGQGPLVAGEQVLRSLRPKVG